MARKEMDMGTYDGVNVNFIVEQGTITVGTLTVPATLALKNENLHPVIEVEGQIDSRLNVMPSTFSFKKINAADTKTLHLVLNVPDSTELGDYEIKVNFDFKIDTPPTTTRAMKIAVVKAAE